MNRGKIIITHNDLDGVGCAVLYLKAFPNAQVYFTDYDKVNELVMEIVTESHWASEIVITDMSPNETVAELLHKRTNVSLIDHHPTAMWLMDTYPWAVVDTAHSATRLVFEMLSNTHLMQDAKDFTMLVDNFDTWGHGKGPSPEAHQLNALMWSMGQERFLKRFVLQSSTTITPTEEMILTLEREREQKYIEEALHQVNILIDTEGHQYGMIAAEQYSSQLGNDILKAYPDIA